MMTRAWRRLNGFLFPCESSDWLTILRVGLGLEIVFYCLSLEHDWARIFASNGNGLISRDLTETVLGVDSSLIPRLGWLVGAAERVGLGEQSVLFIAWLLLLCAGALLVVGLFSRSAAIVAWFLHLCAVKSGDFMAYGIDNFTTIGLFYLMISPLPDTLALDARLRPRAIDPHTTLGFSHRVLQLHVCIIYFFSGLTKCLGGGWWTGATLWRALTRPPFNIISPGLLLPWRHFLPALGIAVCLLEIGYPLFIWLRRTRPWWLGAIVAMHIAIGLAMGLHLFALVMIVLNLAAFPPRRLTFSKRRQLAPAGAG